MALKFDQNNNGINDNFEEKLNSLQQNECDFKKTEKSTKVLTKEEIINKVLDNKNLNLQKISLDQVPIIVQFPKNKDISLTILLFEKCGGTIKSIYKSAINGFAGSIDCNGLNLFCERLKYNNFPFLIEEDGVVKANLYYASRNMNLRPYTWNSLRYEGDNKSSIAIIDTGIDDTHSSFSNGYGDQDFTKKIVGWKDEVNLDPAPYDDNGHGSHCAGITGGEGISAIDYKGRSVSTHSIGLNFTGYFTFPGEASLIAARFNVTNVGEIVEIECNFTDFTPIDGVRLWAYLYHEESIKDYYEVSSSNWQHNLTDPTASLGDYSLRLVIYFDDINGDWLVEDFGFRFRGEIHWPFNPPSYDSGNSWKGVAPNARLVGVKVLDSGGSGWTSDIIDGINWIISNKMVYNITVISMSLGGSAGQSSMISAVNNAVEAGIVTVVAAGNSGGGGNNIGSPGDADKVITVAAMNYRDLVTSYSSSGGPSATGYTIKPDIMAPGGSEYDFTMFSVDSNDNDAEGLYARDDFANDTFPAMGTSMATPAVAGAANLLIEAMGGRPNWTYSGIEAKKVKSLLLMTATETYPLPREVESQYSPLLNRGGKDIQEGFGRINIDAAIEAWTQELTELTPRKAWISSSYKNSFSKHALGCYVNLIEGESYKFNLSGPIGADFDLYLYRNATTSYGEPILLASSISAILGKDEIIDYTAPYTGKYYLVAKAISGEGYANMTYIPNKNASTLSSGKVSPTQCNQSTLITFSVNYTDLDNITPHYVNVSINTTYYIMEKQNPSDLNYTDGCIYEFSTYLQPDKYNYSYIFGCKDGRFHITTAEYENLNVSYFNSNLPSLTNGQVEPYYGYNGTTNFVYVIKYIDLDNNAPHWVNITINSTTYSTIKQNLTDSNYMDGCYFVYNTTLENAGNYNFTFRCTDNGTIIVNSSSYIGPIVKDSRTLENYRTISNYIYDWIDASDGLRSQMYSQDDETEKYYLPFKFKFYNETFTSFFVCTNGFISFLNESSFYNVPYPSDDYDHYYTIAPFWEDLYAYSPCTIFVKNLTSPNRVVIEWENFYTYGYWPYLVGSFEIVLYENSDILFNYDYLNYATDYTCGLNFGPNKTYYNSYTGLSTSTNDFAILFTVWPNDYVPPGGKKKGGTAEEEVLQITQVSGEPGFSLLEFLTSPVGLLIIGGSVAAVIVAVILIKKSARKSLEREKETIGKIIQNIK